MSYAAATMSCVPGTLAQQGGAALGAQAGEARLREGCALHRARRGGGRAGDRMVLDAVRAWVANDMPHALAVSEELASRYPRELATAKAAQYHYFNLGDAPGMLRISEKIGAANDDLAYTHGMAAFAYEQAHMIEDAEAAALRAIALKCKEPWAHHALSHVFLAQGRTGEARAFLDDVKETWTDLNSFMFIHNWWHMALVQIDQGETGAVLTTYDRAIRGSSGPLLLFRTNGSLSRTPGNSGNRRRPVAQQVA